MQNPLENLLPEALHFSSIEATQFVLLLGIILFIGSLGGLIFQKLKIPQVVGYIVIGIIIGASGLQILRPQVITALNPVNSISLSLIGFLVGGELKFSTI